MTEQALAVVVPAHNERTNISLTLGALHAQRLGGDVLHIVVNNASTDGTEGVVEQFGRDHEGFPLVLLNEEEKGTGSAADTGFRHAIDRGYTVIGRTDADAHPSPNWTSIISRNFVARPDLQLLGGASIPLTDGHFRLRDRLLWPLTIIGRNILALGDGGVNKVIGNNMATTADAYLATGGFPRTAIEEADEDHVYAERVLEHYGRDAIGVDPDLLVSISMRRVRALGYLGYIRYRMHKVTRDAETVDIRPPVVDASPAIGTAAAQPPVTIGGLTSGNTHGFHRVEPLMSLPGRALMPSFDRASDPDSL